MTGRVSLVAHRGQPLSFPENSLEGFSHVLKTGGSYIETDVHITADGIPVLSHDANLLKLTGKQIIVADHSYDEIKNMSAGYSEKFGDQFSHCRIATVEQFSDLLKGWPDVTCFIEIKDACLNYFGLKAVNLIIDALQSIHSQCTVISFNYDALEYAKSHYDLPVGWVLPVWSEQNRVKSSELNPDYLLVSTKFCPQETANIWPGSWEWIVYTINSAEDVEHYASLGFELIETNRFSELKQESKIVDVSHDF